MIRGKYLSSMEDIRSVLSLRAAILPASCAEASRDAHDDMCFYALAMEDDGTPVGTGRLYIDDESRFHLGTIAVLPEYRHRGFGDLIARMLLYRALDLNAPSVCAVCPVNSIGFLQRYAMRPVGEVVRYLEQDCRVMEASAEELNLEGSCHKSAKCQGCGEGDCANCDKQ